MKKIAFTILIILCHQALLAQRHTPMDTIVGRKPTYFYQFWFDSVDFVNDRHKCPKELRGMSPTEIAKYNYTDSTLKVIGVAAYSACRYPQPSYPWLPQCADTSFDNWYENLILYKPTDTGFVNLASGRYNARDTTCLMKVYSHRWGVDSVSIDIFYIPIYEVYFDEPITVTDSFYVAATNYHGIVDSQTMTYPGPQAPSAYYTPWLGSLGDRCYLQQFAWKDQTNNFVWKYEYRDYVFVIFPIIDTTQPVPEVCERPVGLRVGWQDSARVRLAWDPGDNNRSWVVAYGPASADPESYPAFASTSPEYTLRYLTPGNEYAARVRAVCFDNSTYSDWSDTIQFRLEGSPTNIPYIYEPTGGLLLQPNPARNEVTIHSEAPLRLVAIFDIQGHKVLEQKAHSHKATIDIHSLTKGSYIVRTTTDHGISTSKLTVE